VPGMNSGLSPSDPVLVAAFRSALLHQGVIALFMIVLLWLIWATARTWRSASSAGKGLRAGAGAMAGTAEARGRSLLRIGFGVLWIFDGILQAQPKMAGGLATQVVEPIAASSPAWVQHLVNWGGTAWSYHPIQAGAASVWIQLGIGAWLVVAARGSWSRLAGVASMAWGLIVWVFGESFGGIFAPGLSWLTGAPGGVLFYVAAGALIALPDEAWRSPRFGWLLSAGLGLFFIGMAVLQAWPGRGYWQGTADGKPGTLAGMVQTMAGTPQTHNNFWQLFVRPAGASRWSLVTPQGVADNGGLVAAGGTGSLTVGFRPSQDLSFSPLAMSTDAGRNWTPGLLDAALASTPGAIAVGPSGRILALLQDGTIQAAATASAATAGQWTQLATLKALAASAPGRRCGLVGVNAVSFGPDRSPMAAGGCVRPGVAGVFTDTDGTWRSAGLTLPGSRRVQALGLAATAGGNTALLAAGNSLFAAWWNGTRWTVSAPVTPGPVTSGTVTSGTVRALGFGPDGGAWLLLADGRAEAIAGAGASWRALPPVPPGTQVLVPAGSATLAPGPGGSYDALAVAGSKLTVWRLTQGAWAKVQLISVPIECGSSS
jgi:hypothetical protein